MKQQQNKNSAGNAEIGSFPARLIDRFNSWRLGISVDAESVLKGFILALLTVFFTLLQTTLFARFRPFGAIPDLMLPFVIAVGTLEKEKIGAAWALIAAFFIDAAGGSEIMLLPLLYVPSAFAAGRLTTHQFRDCVPTAAAYTVVTTFLRGIITFIIASITVHGITWWKIIKHIVVPEFFANLLLAAFPQLLTRAVLRPFHKTRSERTGR